MTGRRLAAALGLTLTLGLSLLAQQPAFARAPDQSPRPPLRGSAEAAPNEAAPDEAALPALRPHPRPEETAPVAGAAPVPPPQRSPRLRPPSAQVTSAAVRPASLPFLSPDRSPLPLSRPDGLEEKVFFKRLKRRKGSVCGDIDIQGDKLGAVKGKLRGCGATDTVRVREVAGVRLSQQAIMTCDTARALKTWVERGVKPAFRRRGPVVEMRVAAHYACRTRNNRPGAKISEHGRAQAIDISAFTMRDGEVITVLKGWGRGTTLRPLREVWKTACGPFGTVLGPKADGYHRDHFHVDVARYRSGPYCR
ncbi:extensin family protein [Antarcticimicrobium luteum]|uniref:Extensin-like protein n=1 Tax=Antarcticimicrobium luteum TaxID=2547397 RepID=A0A4R5UQK4_9RHOB|nr:extensin family protein [Antarcticimicrobium luteum]TDK41312.1 extensin-like protein [Antarcticimicrobium luteum]